MTEADQPPQAVAQGKETQVQCPSNPESQDSPVPSTKWAKTIWEKEIEPRLQLIACAQKSLPQHPQLSDASRFSLAATEVFVQKAQSVLTWRARGNYVFAAASVGLLLYALYYLAHDLVAGMSALESITFDDEYGFYIFLLRSLTITACYFVAVTILFSFAKAFITSASELLDRRHALRFGKLVVYHNHDKSLGTKDLELAFQWNRIGNLEYLDLKSESIKSPVGQMTSVIDKLIDRLPTPRRHI